MDALMTHLDAVDVVHVGEGLVLVVVHVTADPDLDLVHVAAAETVMTNEVVAVMMIVVARKRANPGLAVAVTAANEAVIGVVIEAGLAARAHEKKVETDLRS